MRSKTSVTLGESRRLAAPGLPAIRCPALAKDPMAPAMSGRWWKCLRAG